MSKLVALVFKEEDRTTLLAGTGSADTPQGQMQTYVESMPEQAEAVLKIILKKAKEAGVELEDAVVVFRSRDGRVKVKQTQEITAGRGARRGSFWGLLAGLLIGGPIAGVLLGMGIGALYGSKVDTGINDKFIKNMASALDRSTSAVLVLIKDEDYERSIAYLKTFDTVIHEADLTEEGLVTMEKMGQNKMLAQAIEDEQTGDDE